jgi:hypothetical protein
MIVHLDGRKFFVEFFEDGRPKAIKEEKVYDPGRPWEATYRPTYWHHSAKIGGPRALPNRILAEAGKVVK